MAEFGSNRFEVFKNFINGGADHLVLTLVSIVVVVAGARIGCGARIEAGRVSVVEFAFHVRLSDYGCRCCGDCLVDPALSGRVAPSKPKNEQRRDWPRNLTVSDSAMRYVGSATPVCKLT